MKGFICVFSVLLLASCSNDWAAGLADRPATADRSAPAWVGAVAPPPILGPARQGVARAFANAPDRGSLVQYPQTPVIRRSGAYTFHAADLSEEHALRATVTGDLSFAAPDGTQITLAYERHVEHPDGNWSWIGRAAAGQGENTVITFGEQAVFGTIPQGGDKPDLRLTVADGRTWVVTADPRLLSEIRNEATHPTRPDYLIPGDLAQAVGASTVEMDIASTSAESDTITAAATVDGNTIVDVLVGFTDGYASYRGGDSAAITRVHNLVDISNQAFANSQVAVRARLVHSMKVSYPDATANKTALEEMTGFKAPSTRTTPASAFSALRSARDKFGADLVVLLRRFQEPENGSCGVAWLIGGGLEAIDSSDQYFGYSVVSDGQDAGTDGKTYFCRDETFAHELGHNMGSQHDSDNAKDDDGSVSYGAFRYSFGLKTSTGGGNFITVMASGDSGETRYRVFSNPNVSICGGFACGVADQADNARSLRQTIPTTASFRATVVPIQSSKARNDIDGDGKSDLMFRYYRTESNNFNYWIMNGPNRVRVGSDTLGVSYQIAATGDFNGDGKLDLVWVAESTRHIVMWIGTGTSWDKWSLGSYGLGWSVAGAGDVNGDGKSDLLFRYYKTAPNNLHYWIMDGASRVRTGSDSMGVSYRIAATGDFDGDGKLDIVWTADSTREAVMWLGTGTSWNKGSLGTYGLGWTVTGAGDVDGDGKSDLLLRYYKSAPNNFNYWIMNGATRVRIGAATMGVSYRMASTGDFNGDGKLDIVWVADSTRGMIMWIGNGPSFNSTALGSYGNGWSVVEN